MYLFTTLPFLILLTPFVVAHGKVAAVQGDAGGNGTALGITGGDVPGTGSNSKTEVDTTVFGKTNIATVSQHLITKTKLRHSVIHNTILGRSWMYDRWWSE